MGIYQCFGITVPFFILIVYSSLVSTSTQTIILGVRQLMFFIIQLNLPQVDSNQIVEISEG
jgi:hypothetical protein